MQRKRKRKKKGGGRYFEKTNIWCEEKIKYGEGGQNFEKKGIDLPRRRGRREKEYEGEGKLLITSNKKQNDSDLPLRNEKNRRLRFATSLH